jgi:hypothetical protein
VPYFFAGATARLAPFILKFVAPIRLLPDYSPGPAIRIVRPFEGGILGGQVFGFLACLTVVANPH